MRIDLQPPARGFFFRSQILGEILAVGLLNLFLPVDEPLAKLGAKAIDWRGMQKNAGS